jgi:hypothetical protein
MSSSTSATSIPAPPGPRVRCLVVTIDVANVDVCSRYVSSDARLLAPQTVTTKFCAASSPLVYDGLVLDLVLACAITVTRPVQEMAHHAAVIVEAKALDTPHHFEVTRTFKGTKLTRVSLEKAVNPASSCYGGPTVPGQSYLLFLGCDDPDACLETSEAIPSTREARAFLEAPRLVTRAEIARTLRRWLAGRISDRALAGWLAEMKDVAETEDWTVIDDAEISVDLGAILQLHWYMREADACAMNHLRNTGVPELLRVLEQANLQVSDLEALDEAFEPACE